MERRVAPPRRTARPFASLACSCSAPRSCHPGLVQAVVGPAQRGCAKHACCHSARDAASPRPHAWSAGAASAGRPARRVPACAQLPAGPLSRCSHVAVPFSSQVHWDRVWIARKVRGGRKKKRPSWQSPQPSCLSTGRPPPGTTHSGRRSRKCHQTSGNISHRHHACPCLLVVSESSCDLAAATCQKPFRRGGKQWQIHAATRFGAMRWCAFRGVTKAPPVSACLGCHTQKFLAPSPSTEGSRNGQKAFPLALD